MRKPVYFTFEVVKPQVHDAAGKPTSGRRSKLTAPIFITPDGVINEFPTEDVQFFTEMPAPPIIPVSHPKIPAGSGYNRMLRSDLERSSRYLRWRDGKREDSRMSLQDSYALFQQQGRTGLKEQFSKTHVFYLLREFKKQGWDVD